MSSIRRPSVNTRGCVVAGCGKSAFKNGYCVDCWKSVGVANDKAFNYPIGFDAAAAACLAFSREELKGLATKFDMFDLDHSGFIDFQELKKAQEKMGAPKTHSELTILMNSMAKDPSLGISFYDFVAVQCKLIGKSMGGASLQLKEVDGSSSFLPAVAAFAQSVSDFSVTGIKSYHEDRFAAEKAQAEREKAIQDKLNQRKKDAEANRLARANISEAQKLAEKKAKEDREREEAERIAADEKRKADRAAFQAKQRAMFEGKK